MRPDNIYHRIIADLGILKMKDGMPGLFYTLLSRPTTLGDEDRPETSAILLIGENVNLPGSIILQREKLKASTKKLQD